MVRNEQKKERHRGGRRCQLNRDIPMHNYIIPKRYARSNVT